MGDKYSCQDAQVYGSGYICAGLILFVKAPEKDNTLTETWYHYDR